MQSGSKTASRGDFGDDTGAAASALPGIGIDETPNERLYARCLADRQSIHRSTPVSGQVPISVGHNYSILAAMPEGNGENWPRWTVPVSVDHVSSMSTAIAVAQGQVGQLMHSASDQRFALKVLTVDSRYPSTALLLAASQTCDVAHGNPLGAIGRFSLCAVLAGSTLGRCAAFTLAAIFAAGSLPTLLPKTGATRLFNTDCPDWLSR